jgi:predicted HAD superfamily hydrolase
MIVGSPVGSLNFMQNQLSIQVNDCIKTQLDKLQRIFSTPNGRVKKDVQTIYRILRLCIPSQLTYLLRTTNPDISNGAASSLDDMIHMFTLKMINAQQLLEDLDDEQKQDLWKRIHLKINSGGVGINSSNIFLEQRILARLR